MRARLLAIIALVAAAGSGVAVAQRGQESWVLSYKTFPDTITHAELSRRYGTANVTEGEIPGQEGFSQHGTMLFANDPTRRVDLVWRDFFDGTRRLLSAGVSGDISKWHTAENITLGTTLRAVEKSNRRPFLLLGFGFDGDGAVVSWTGGALSRQDASGCHTVARFTPTQPIPRVAMEVFNPEEYSSAHAGMQAAGIVVRGFGVSYGLWLRD